MAVFDFRVEECIGFQDVVQNFWLHDVTQVVEGALDVHGDELADRTLERLHLIKLAVIFKHAVLLVFAIDLVSESIVIFVILLTAKKLLPNVHSLFTELLHIQLVDEALLHHLFVEKFRAFLVEEDELFHVLVGGI